MVSERTKTPSIIPQLLSAVQHHDLKLSQRSAYLKLCPDGSKYMKSSCGKMVRIMILILGDKDSRELKTRALGEH